MFRFLTSKKGFTMVELLITLILLGLGAFALLSLFNAGYRSFHKSQERYEKQETVKNIAEIFQNKSKVGAASSCSIFNSLGVLPSAGSADDAYSYLFLIPVFENADGTYDATYKYGDNVSAAKMKTMAGYYIYRLDQSIVFSYNDKGEPDLPCMNYGFPLYVEFSPYKENGRNMPALNIRICAVDEGTQFKYEKVGSVTQNGTTTDVNAPTAPESEDNIFYELTVRSHFPNMVSNSSEIAVNASSGLKEENGNLITDEATVNGAQVLAVDKGTVIRLTVDSIFAGDASQAETSVTSFCFIATASYGADSGEVGLLCDFRDNILLKSDLGKAFVKAYYTVSPGIADIIRESEPLKAIVRFSLKPLVVVASYALNPDLVKEQIPLIISFIVIGFVLSSTLVYLDKKRKRNN